MRIEFSITESSEIIRQSLEIVETVALAKRVHLLLLKEAKL